VSVEPLGHSLGRPIRGPSAFGGDWRRLMNLTRTLAFTDFKLKFFGSVLGYFWQLMRPLLLFGVLYTVFTKVLKFGVGVKFYPAILLTNIVLFTFFAEVTGQAVTSVVDREGLVRKIQFPRLAIPLSVVLSGYLNLVLNLVAICVFMAIQGVGLHWSQLELPLLLLALGAFAAGGAMILSAMYVRFRDVKPIWEVVLQAVYFATPILYTFEAVSDRTTFRHIVFSNPLAVLFEQVRHAVFDPNAPDALQAAGGWGWLAIPIAIFVATIAFGVWYFDRAAPRVAEEL
jgi:ABC-2 type transport system permease protein